MIWRFAPMADPLVEEWHSRDLDSCISAREAAAVRDWKNDRLSVGLELLPALTHPAPELE